MNERQYIHNVRSIVFAQNRKRFDAGGALDREIVRRAQGLRTSGMTGDALEVQIERLIQVARNEAVGVIAGYNPITLEAVLEAIADTPAEA